MKGMGKATQGDQTRALYFTPTKSQKREKWVESPITLIFDKRLATVMPRHLVNFNAIQSFDIQSFCFKVSHDIWWSHVVRICAKGSITLMPFLTQSNNGGKWSTVTQFLTSQSLQILHMLYQQRGRDMYTFAAESLYFNQNKISFSHTYLIDCKVFETKNSISLNAFP